MLNAERMDLFAYSDYRSYLRDFYSRQKIKNPNYSYRVFARRAGLRSPNYLGLVIDNKRRITDTNLPRFIRGLGLTRKEGEYFRILVLYDQSADPAAKEEYLKELLHLRSRSTTNVPELDRSRLEVLTYWYHWVIREMVLLDEFRADPAWIASRLGNRISQTQAADSVKLLLRLHLLTKKDGRYEQSEPLISTTDGISCLQIREIHRQFVDLAVKSIFHEPIQNRAESGLTIALSRDQVPEFRKMIGEFRRDLNLRFSRKSGNDEVFHLAMHFFPVTTQRSAS